MDQEHKRLEFITRFVIFVPLIILLFSLLFKSNNPKKAVLNSQLTPTLILKQTEAQTASNIPKVNKNNVKLDLYGPYRCVYKTEQSTIDVSVRNKHIAVLYETGSSLTHVVVTDTCGYKWDEGSTKGDKMCNISQYMSIVEMLSSMNILKFDSILSMVNQVAPGSSIDSSMMSAVTDTCKKEDISEAIFTIPQSISFTDLQTATQSAQ